MTELGSMPNFFARARVYVLIASLALIGQTSRAAAPAELIKTFRTTTDSAVRLQARQDIIKAGPDAVPALIAEMAHNARGRDTLRRLLQDIGSTAAPKLLDLTQDAELAPWAASGLFWTVNEKSVDLMPRLAECAAREDVRRSCLDAMVKIAGPKAKGHTAAIAKLLSVDNAETKVYACSILGRIGSGAKKAVPELEKAAQSPDAAVKQAAEDALRRVRG